MQKVQEVSTRDEFTDWSRVLACICLSLLDVNMVLELLTVTVFDRPTEEYYRPFLVTISWEYVFVVLKYRTKRTLNPHTERVGIICMLMSRHTDTLLTTCPHN